MNDREALLKAIEAAPDDADLYFVFADWLDEHGDAEATKYRCLGALLVNEDDTAARAAYADWLEQQGQYEEAERQYAWPAAKGYLMWLTDRAGRRVPYDADAPSDADPYEDWVDRISYRRLLELGRRAAADGSFHFFVGTDEWLCDELRKEPDKFWRAWATVTGHALPKEFTPGGFSCGC
jgi:uncharacterized protein (TIGR02996 family)